MSTAMPARMAGTMPMRNLGGKGLPAKGDDQVLPVAVLLMGVVQETSAKEEHGRQVALGGEFQHELHGNDAAGVDEKERAAKHSGFEPAEPSRANSKLNQPITDTAPDRTSPLEF